MRHLRKGIFTAAAGAALLATAGAGAQPAPQNHNHNHGAEQARAQAPAAVRIVDFGFQSNNLTVPAGTSVTWTNTGNAPHTATAKNGAFDSKRLTSGQTFSFTFSQPGSFAYQCDIHPSMQGTITVQGGAAQAATATAAPATAAAATAAARTATPPPAGGEQRGARGVAGIGDSAQGRSDLVRLDVEALTPESGVTFVAWLTGASGNFVKLGELRPDTAGKATVSYTDAQNRNLIALYERIIVTAETGTPGERPAGREVMRDEVPAGAMVHIRHLLASFESTPKNTPLATGLLGQAALAQDHALLAQRAVTGNDLAGARQHLEHVINIIEGDKGRNFGDHNGDERRENPGDGFGALVYGTETGQHAQLAIDAAPRDEMVSLHGGHVIIAAKNANDWLTQARDAAIPAAKLTSTAAVRGPVDTIVDLTTAALQGRDANRDGRIDPVPGEGAARTAYDHAQLMATLEPSAALVAATGAANNGAAAAPATQAPAAQANAAPAATQAAAPVEAAAAVAAVEDEDDGNQLVLIGGGIALALVLLLGLGGWWATGRKARA